MIELDPAYVIGTGGAIGAWLRHYVGSLADVEGFPVGTFAVNVLGSFFLGLITFVGMDATFVLLLGTGVCGSFTTFSSFSFETVRLWETGEPVRAAGNAFGNLAGAAVALGLAWSVAGFL